MNGDTIVFHNDSWKEIYETESEAIRENQGDNFVEIHHIGSTSICEVYAKPKIDIALIVNSLEASKKLNTIEYHFKGCLNIPFRYFYTKRTNTICSHIHAMLPGDPELEGFLIFRNYMNNHHEAREKYSALKIKIKNLLDASGDEQLLNKYTLAKNEFITSILKEAGFKGYCMRLVCHNAEHEYEQSVYKSVSPDDIRVIFYKGADIIGYANANKNGKINFFTVSENEEYFSNRFKSYLETLKC